MSTGSIYISRGFERFVRSGSQAGERAAVLIEAQTAYLVVQARLAMAPYLTEQATTEGAITRSLRRLRNRSRRFPYYPDLERRALLRTPGRRR